MQRLLRQQGDFLSVNFPRNNNNNAHSRCTKIRSVDSLGVHLPLNFQRVFFCELTRELERRASKQLKITSFVLRGINCSPMDGKKKSLVSISTERDKCSLEQGCIYVSIPRSGILLLPSTSYERETGTKEQIR